MSEQPPRLDLAAIAKEYGEMLSRGMDPELADKEIRKKYPSLEGNVDWEVMDRVAFKPLRSVLSEKAGRQSSSDLKKTEAPPNELGGSSRRGMFDDLGEKEGFPLSTNVLLLIQLMLHSEMEKLPLYEPVDTTQLIRECTRSLQSQLSEPVIRELAASLRNWVDDVKRSASDGSLEKCAQAGDINSMLELGARCFRSEPRDRGKGEKWYRTAAENGNAEAMVRLGALYLHEDTEKAVLWLEKASDCR